MDNLERTKKYDRFHRSECRSGDVFLEIRKPHSGKWDWELKEIKKEKRPLSLYS